MTLETILRSEPRYVSPLAGSLRASILEAAMELAPDLAPRPERRTLSDGAPARTRREFDPEGSLPVWRRHRDIHGQGLVEYALILALIAAIAIVALLFLGSAISALLSTLGESI